jgi:hypothetical protein
MKRIIFIEGHIRKSSLCESYLDGPDILQLQARLGQLLSRKDLTFELLEDILQDERSGRHRLGADYDDFKAILVALKMVEYLGPNTNATCYSSNDAEIKVQLYQLYDTGRSLEEIGEIPQTEITRMPHVRFSGIWDE